MRQPRATSNVKKTVKPIAASTAPVEPSPSLTPLPAGTGPTQPQPLALDLKPTIEPSDLYKEARVDIRTYGQLEIQVVTLLLTTMFILLGWLASSYATDTYKTAMRVAAPQLTAAPDPKNPMIIPGIRDRADTPSEEVNRNFSVLLNNGTILYRKMLLESPISSLILGGVCFFIVVVAGTLIILTFQIQRRRYATHRAITAWAGIAKDPMIDKAQPTGEAHVGIDEAIGDPVLIVRALSLFILIVLVTAWLILCGLVGQLWFCLNVEKDWPVKIILGYMMLIILLKMTHTTYMYRNFIIFEKCEGNDYLVSEGTARLERIRTDLGTPELDDDFNDLISSLEQSHYKHRRKLWHKFEGLRRKIDKGPTKDKRALDRELEEMGTILRTFRPTYRLLIGVFVVIVPIWLYLSLRT